MRDFLGTERFEVRRRIGAGGMGVVYEAFDRERDATVALKTVRRLDADALYRFKREFRALQDVQHPNLVRLDELYVDDDVAFFTMEYVAGVTLVDYARAALPVDVGGADTLRVPEARFDESKLRAAAGQLAAALHALHGAGHVHRDVKPANVLVAGDGRVVLLDFGLVARADPELHSTGGHIVGTAAYMAPEQAMGGAVGPAADWYSFGVVLFETVTGQHPYAGAPAEILIAKQRQDAPRASDIEAGVPGDLDELIAHLLRRDPDARAGAGEVFGALRGDDDPAPSSSGRTMTAPFVGRREELAVLSDALRRARDGDAALVLVRGESGVGKSELVRTFVDHARADDPRLAVLVGRCYERESVPYKAFDGVADSLCGLMARVSAADAASLLPTNAYLLPRLFPVLERVPAIANAPAPVRESDDPREVRARMFGAFRELMIRLAQRRPTVVVIDDYQWADADSTALLRDLVAPPEPPSLLLVATMRADAEVPELDGAAWHAVDLGNLADAEAGELVRLLAPGLADAGTGARIVAESRGHPLFIQELARASDGATGLRLEDAIVRRVAALPDGTRRALELLAVAGEPIALAVIADVLGVDRADAAVAIQELRVASLARSARARSMEQFEPYHDRIRAAVRESVAAADARALHAALAGALERSGEAPERILRALRAAGDRARAATYAELAARRALRAHAFDRAGELFLAALEDGTWDAAQTRELRRLAGDAFVNAGQGGPAAEQLLLAAEGAPAKERAELFRLAAEMLLTSGHIVDGMRSLEELLAEIGVAFPADARRALWSMVWDRAVLRVRGLGWKPRDPDDLSTNQLREIDIYKTVAHGLSMVDTVRGMSFQARALRLALRAGEPGRVAQALAREAGFSSVRGRVAIPRSLALIERARAIAAELPDPYVAWFVRGCEVGVWYFDCRFADAARQALALDVEGRELPRGAWWEISTMRVFRGLSLHYLGHLEEHARFAQASIRDAQRRSDQHTAAIIGRLSHLAWLASSGADGARRRLDEAAWHPLTDGYHLHHWYMWRARAEIALYEGTPEQVAGEVENEFARVEQSLLTHVQPVRVASAWLRGRMIVAEARRTGDRRGLRRARKLARAMGREGMAPYTVEGLLLAGCVDAVDDRAERAIASFDRAASLARAAGMIAHQAAALLGHGTMLGGDRGRALAESGLDLLRAQAVTDPVAYARIYVPGL